MHRVNGIDANSEGSPLSEHALMVAALMHVRRPVRPCLDIQTSCGGPTLRRRMTCSCHSCVPLIWPRTGPTRYRSDVSRSVCRLDRCCSSSPAPPSAAAAACGRDLPSAASPSARVHVPFHHEQNSDQLLLLNQLRPNPTRELRFHESDSGVESSRVGGCEARSECPRAIWDH